MGYLRLFTEIFYEDDGDNIILKFPIFKEGDNYEIKKFEHSEKDIIAVLTSLDGDK